MIMDKMQYETLMPQPTKIKQLTIYFSLILFKIAERTFQFYFTVTSAKITIEKNN